MKYQDLTNATDIFFHNHWASSKPYLPPKWSGIHFDFRKIPSFDKQGCYAFFCNDELIYVGPGISSGSNAPMVGYKYQGIVKIEHE